MVQEDLKNRTKSKYRGLKILILTLFLITSFIILIGMMIGKLNEVIYILPSLLIPIVIISSIFIFRKKTAYHPPPQGKALSRRDARRERKREMQEREKQRRKALRPYKLVAIGILVIFSY